MVSCLQANTYGSIITGTAECGQLILVPGVEEVGVHGRGRARRERHRTGSGRDSELDFHEERRHGVWMSVGAPSCALRLKSCTCGAHAPTTSTSSNNNKRRISPPLLWNARSNILNRDSPRHLIRESTPQDTHLLPGPSEAMLDMDLGECTAQALG